MSEILKLAWEYLKAMEAADESRTPEKIKRLMDAFTALSSNPRFVLPVRQVDPYVVVDLGAGCPCCDRDMVEYRTALTRMGDDAILIQCRTCDYAEIQLLDWEEQD